MLARSLASSLLRQASHRYPQCSRPLHSTPSRKTLPTALDNILAGGPAPTVYIKTANSEGIHLADGLIIPGPCVFLEGKTFLWNVPETLWEGWTNEHFELFDTVVPKPEILLLGTGRKLSLPPPSLRQYLNKIGIQVDLMDTWNACSTYNLLAEEGRRVAAAVLPLTSRSWTKA